MADGKNERGTPKSVVITGSTRGIGLAMAVEFLKAGCRVTVSGRGEALPAAAAAALAPFEGNWTYVPCDVRSREASQRLWDASVERWGGVDVWVANAGRNAPHAVAWETDEDAVDCVVQTNLTGMILGTQVAAAEMVRRGHGAIYAMEGLGSNDMFQPKTILYGTTKRALTYYLQGLAKELEGTGVLAGRLSPGMMLTDFITKAPDGTPSDVLEDERFRRVFNILGDRPETVAAFLVPRMLANRKNGVRIAWLTNAKAMGRFLTAGRRKGRLLG